MSYVPPAKGEGKGCTRCNGRGEIAGQASHRSIKPHHESKPPGRVDSEYEEFLPQVADAIQRGDEKGLNDLCLEMDVAAKEKVAQIFAGQSVTEVIRRLGSTVTRGWVESARRVHRHDLLTGQPLEGWQGMSDEQRKTAASKCFNRNLSEREAAMELGTNRDTIRRAWGRREAA